MGRKKGKKKAAAAEAADAGASAAASPAAENGRKDPLQLPSLFEALQEKAATWYDREREGIALIEGFQSAMVASRDAASSGNAAASPQSASKDTYPLDALSGLAGNAQMDPWLAEDLFQQVQDLPQGFEALLDDMYSLQTQARAIVLGQAASLLGTADQDVDDKTTDAAALAPVDYLQMMNQDLAAFEAEYQHVEALVRLISFETPTDELRTLAISWSTSPFLDPAQSRAFRQRHEISQRLQSIAAR